MLGYEPASVSRGGFRFCRWSVAAMVWVGVAWRVEALILAAALIMAASAALTVRRAPLIWLYTVTVNRAFPSPAQVLDATGMRLAHVVATLALGVPWAVLRFGPDSAAAATWRVLLFVAVFKTAGALGYCPASRMFTCALGGGTCCPWMRSKAS